MAVKRKKKLTHKQRIAAMSPKQLKAYRAMKAEHAARWRAKHGKKSKGKKAPARAAAGRRVVKKAAHKAVHKAPAHKAPAVHKSAAPKRTNRPAPIKQVAHKAPARKSARKIAAW